MMDDNKLALASNVTAQTLSPLIIVATYGTSGDMLPFVTLAQGLHERGHRVLMLVPAFQEAVPRSAGVPFQVFGAQEEGQALMGDSDLSNAHKAWGAIWKYLAPHLGAMRGLIQNLPSHETCVVLCHPILVPMAALARPIRPSMRIVAAYLAPSNLCSSHDMVTAGPLLIPPWVPLAWLDALWKLIHKWFDSVMLPSLNAARTQYGLPPISHFFQHLLKAPDASVGLFPKWFAPRQPDWPQCFLEGDFVSAPIRTGHTLPPEVERFLSDGEPPIIFTPGTGHQHAALYFSIALAALKRLGRRGVFITPHVAQLPARLPSDIISQAYAPFTALLPRAAAVVHHGGIGTMAEAFRAGIPQLVVPFAFDQFDNGFRAKRLGVADVLLAKRLSVGRMQKKLPHLLASAEVTQACKALAQKMALKADLPWLMDQVEAALFDPFSVNAKGVANAAHRCRPASVARPSSLRNDR